MGVSESRIIAETVLSSCQMAETEGKTVLDERSLWKDKRVRELAKGLHDHLPRDIREGTGPSSIEKAVKKLRRNGTIIIPEVVEDLLDGRRMLFHEGVDFQSCHPSSNTGDPSKPLCYSLPDCYALLNQYEKDKEPSLICLRLLYVLFFHLKERIHPGVKSKRGSRSLAKEIMKLGSVQDESQVTQKLHQWIDLGERYSLIAKDLGGLGSLLILPNIGGEWIYQRELPKSSQRGNRTLLIECLKDHGIVRESMDNCLNALAESEMAKVWVPMISSLSGVTTNSLLQTGSSGDQLQASENVTTASPHVDAPSTLANPADEVQFSEPLPCGLSSNAISTAPGLPTGQLQYSQPWLGASQDEYLHPNYIDRDAEAQFVAISKERNEALEDSLVDVGNSLGPATQGELSQPPISDLGGTGLLQTWPVNSSMDCMGNYGQMQYYQPAFANTSSNMSINSDILGCQAQFPFVFDSHGNVVDTAINHPEIAHSWPSEYQFPDEYYQPL